jgi:hypothetical protein
MLIILDLSLILQDMPLLSGSYTEMGMEILANENILLEDEFLCPKKSSL